jgi:adenylate cyclase
MNQELNGELLPVGGGDAIPLIRPVLTLGRRESCDICMPFPNISGIHCELSFVEGYWWIRDKNSTNGIKVNGQRVLSKLLHPNDEITIGKRRYSIKYELPANRNKLDEFEEDLMGESLLEKAGLERRRPEDKPRPRRFEPVEFMQEDEEEK